MTIYDTKIILCISISLARMCNTCMYMYMYARQVCMMHVDPLPQDYPEYYRVISEPIDLNTIKKNVEVVGGRRGEAGGCRLAG